MKFKTLSIFAFGALMAVACGESASTETAEETTPEEPTVETVTYMASADESSVNWKGEVVGVYGHEGIIDMQSGKVMVAGDQIVDGEFVIDMSTIWPTDSASFSEENPAEKLVGHLGTDDFFSVDEFPTSSFKIKSVNGNQITGDLTVKGQTHEETLEVENMEITEDGMMMSGVLVFDRQKYGVSWEHYVKDYVLSDDIQISYTLVATK